jgi:Holliday junction resolvase RusA-like endonuclease
MGVRFTKEQAERLTIIENRVKLRPTKKEAIEKAELEAIRQKAVRAKNGCKNDSPDITTIFVRPMSQNEAWKGRRFKSKKYRGYEKAVLLMLPKLVVPKGRLRVEFEFGFSNDASDIDNPVKSILDILQKKYGFNDKKIYLLLVKKVIVQKGEDYFSFRIESL